MIVELDYKAGEDALKLDGKRFVLERTCTVECVEFSKAFMTVFTRFSCGHVGEGVKDWYNYCPNCGAKVTPKCFGTTPKVVEE